MFQSITTTRNGSSHNDERDVSSHNRRKRCFNPLQLQGMAHPIMMKEMPHLITDERDVSIHYNYKEWLIP